MPVMPCQMALPMVFCPPFGTDQGCDQESTDESFQDSSVKRAKSFVGGDFCWGIFFVPGLHFKKNKKTAEVKHNLMIELKKD